eukprot:TRINITY_DN2966_c0_g6_i1.p1 TRINITY_DN2966_c0_g6~~TRINITY_DN2966_c0_g6_i1.p1  ORF type:complete len:557 (+),score=52.01 TRINITY_DN2966_c0_g6_i1:36-1673(+)
MVQSPRKADMSTDVQSRSETKEAANEQSDEKDNKAGEGERKGEGEGEREGKGGEEESIELDPWAKAAADFCFTIACCLKTLAVDCLNVRFSNVGKLKTTEDPFNVHKCLGISCLVHFVYRCLRLVWTGTTGLQQDSNTPVCLALHAALNLSSFVFHLPKTRVKARPMIYPEFRLHSSIFALRSIICALLLWWEPACSPLLRGGVCLVAMKLADMATERYGDSATDTTIRGMPYPAYMHEWVRWAHNLHYAFMQGVATIMMFSANTPDDPFLVLLVVQLAPFLMMLVRKSVVNGPAWHFYYTGLSIFVFWCRSLLWDDTASACFQPYYWGFCFLALRVVCRLNKYILWSLLIFACVLVQQQEPTWSSLQEARSTWRSSQPTDAYVMSLAEQGNFVSLKALLGMHPSLVRAQNRDNFTVLHYAASYGQTRLITRCLRSGLPVDGYIDSEHITQTPLTMAVLGDDLKVVKLLLKRGASPYLALPSLFVKGRYEEVSMAVRKELMRKIKKSTASVRRGVLDTFIRMAEQIKGTELFVAEAREVKWELEL